MNQPTQPVKIWIFRKNTGCLRVFPSPVIVARGSRLQFKNLTESAATVDIKLSGVRGLDIPAGEERALTLPGSGVPPYHEYEVEVKSARGVEQAEGGSRPSVIIDP